MKPRQLLSSESHVRPIASRKSMRSEPVGNARFSAFNKEIALVVKLERGKELIIAVHKSETVHELKKRVLELCPDYARTAHFFYKGVGLNELKTLKMYGISAGETLFLSPWKSDPFARSRFLPQPLSEVQVTVTVHTPRGQELRVEVLGSDTVRVLWEKVKRLSRFELFHSHEMVLGRQVLQSTVEMRELGLGTSGGFQIVLRITVKVTSLKGANWTLKVLASDPVGVIRDEICDEPEVADKVAICCEEKELKDSLTFDFYQIRPNMHFHGKVRVPFTIQTSAGTINLHPFQHSTIWKVGFEAAISANLNPYDRYQLVQDGVPLNDYSKLSDMGIHEEVPMELIRLGTPPAFPAGPNGVSGQLVLTAVLKHLLAPTLVIATKKTTEELLWEGFSRANILNPLELFRALILHGERTDYGNKAALPTQIRLDVAVISSLRLSITISPYESVAALKAVIEDRTNFPMSQQRLLFGGGILEDNYPLDFYSVKDGSWVVLVVAEEHPYFLLPADALDPSTDQDFTDEEDYGEAGTVGGQGYYPPYGWKRYGFKVTGLYNSEVWKETEGGPGEWAVVYHGLHPFFDSEHIATPRDSVFSAADLKLAEVSQALVPFESRYLKFAFQSKANPSSLHTEGQFFSSPSDHDLRPFGFLMKFGSTED